MKRIIITISAVASIALFVSIFVLISNAGNPESAAARTAGVSDQRPATTIPTPSTNAAAPTVTKVTSPSATATNTAQAVTPQSTRTTKTS